MTSVGHIFSSHPLCYLGSSVSSGCYFSQPLRVQFLATPPSLPATKQCPLINAKSRWRHTTCIAGTERKKDFLAACTPFIQLDIFPFVIRGCWIKRVKYRRRDNMLHVWMTSLNRCHQIAKVQGAIRKSTTTSDKVQWEDIPYKPERTYKQCDNEDVLVGRLTEPVVCNQGLKIQH